MMGDTYIEDIGLLFNPDLLEPITINIPKALQTVDGSYIEKGAYKIGVE